MPPLGYLIGGVNFTELNIVIREARMDEAGAVIREAVTIEYGMFIQHVHPNRVKFSGDSTVDISRNQKL